jgi:hypothetical protein
LLANLYRIPAGAEHFAVWERARGVAAVAAVSIGASWQNLQQRPFKLASVAGQLQPGAAQFAVGFNFFIADPDGVQYTNLGGGELLRTIAALVTGIGWPIVGEVIIPPRWFLVLQGYFNAAAAANTVTLNSAGWFIPRGSLSTP